MALQKIGFVVGLTAEARLLRGFGFAVHAGGGTPAGAGAAAQSLLDGGATALISFGLAGGLSPTLAAGDVLVPATVVTADFRYVCDAEMRDWLGGTTGEALLAGTNIAVTAAEKRDLFVTFAADAVDLESGAVARVAMARGRKFAVLRAVADPAHRNLPPAALVALDGAGRIGLAAVLASVMRQPGQIPGLIALASDAAKARAALSRKLRSLPAPWAELI